MGFLFAALEPFCEAAEAACFGDSLAVFSFCSQPVELLLSFSWPDCCKPLILLFMWGFMGDCYQIWENYLTHLCLTLAL